MARPRKEDILKKSRKIDFRLDETEYEIIESRAMQAGMTVSEFVRHQAIHGKCTVCYSLCADNDELRQILVELRAIGNNINQIARYFNLGGIHSNAIREEIYRCVNELMSMREMITKLAGDYDGYIETSYE